MTRRNQVRRPAAELLGERVVPRNAKGRLIETAIDLFYTHGFHAVGLDQILDETGVTKTTFYKHFESKEDLIVAAIRERDAWERRAWGRAIEKRAGDDPRAKLLALYDVLDEWFNRPDFRGCIFINAAAEFVDPNDPVHRVAAEYKRACRDGWRDLARAAGARDAETFADLYTAIVEGTLILRHVHGRNDAARVTRGMVERLVEEYMPAGAGAGERLESDVAAFVPNVSA
jgi:AcrR family transcriptional regulator